MTVDVTLKKYKFSDKY